MSDEAIPLPQVLAEAGLNVTYGQAWEHRGEPMRDAESIRVIGSGTTGRDVAGDVEALKASGLPTAYVARSGKVWLLSQATEGTLLVVVAVHEGGETTAAQRDAVAALVSILEAVAFDATTTIELTEEPAPPATEVAMKAPAKKAARPRKAAPTRA